VHSYSPPESSFGRTKSLGVEDQNHNQKLSDKAIEQGFVETESYFHATAKRIIYNENREVLFLFLSVLPRARHGLCAKRQQTIPIL